MYVLSQGKTKALEETKMKLLFYNPCHNKAYILAKKKKILWNECFSKAKNLKDKIQMSLVKGLTVSPNNVPFATKH